MRRNYRIIMKSMKITKNSTYHKVSFSFRSKASIHSTNMNEQKNFNMYIRFNERYKHRYEIFENLISPALVVQTCREEILTIVTGGDKLARQADIVSSVNATKRDSATCVPRGCASLCPGDDDFP